VQGFPSSTVGAAPGTHAALASQISRPLQALPSEQLVPTATGTCWTPVAGSHESTVQGFPSLTVGATPGRQLAAALHVSSPSQAFPFEHDVPAAAGVWLTPVAASHASTVQGL
jgi:hypothetical protein